MGSISNIDGTLYFIELSEADFDNLIYSIGFIINFCIGINIVCFMDDI